jgi:ubiquitin-conjugating enzyme E2 O
VYGIILRCWHDAEDLPAHGAPGDPLMRPLQRGEVGVSYFVPQATREILPESCFTLVDRSFQPGDYCKRSIDDVRSGVVTSISVRGRVEHAITGVPVEGWKGVEDLEEIVDADIGSYVVYDDWVGQVIDVCLSLCSHVRL